jgi:hypothetical protein
MAQAVAVVGGGGGMNRGEMEDAAAARAVGPAAVRARAGEGTASMAQAVADGAGGGLPGRLTKGGRMAQDATAVSMEVGGDETRDVRRSTAERKMQEMSGSRQAARATWPSWMRLREKSQRISSEVPPSRRYSALVVAGCVAA